MKFLGSMPGEVSISGRSIGVLILGLALCLLLVSVDATAAVRKGISEAESRASERYWTPARVRQAVRNGSPADRSSEKESLVGPRHIPVPQEWRNPAIGKLVYREAGTPYSCSGAVINTRSKRLVLTAAHCLLFFDWSNFVRFIPDYERGSRPYRSWSPRWLWVTRGWWRSGNPNYDVGIIVMRSPIGDKTGSIDYEPYPRRKGFSRIYGYPAGAMRGERQRVCESSTWAGDFLSFRLPGPNALVARCNMAGGSSGGPWLSLYEDEQGAEFWQLDGLTSRSIGSGKIVSPYLGRQFVQLVRQAQR